MWLLWINSIVKEIQNDYFGVYCEDLYNVIHLLRGCGFLDYGYPRIPQSKQEAKVTG